MILPKEELYQDTNHKISYQLTKIKLLWKWEYPLKKEVPIARLCVEKGGYMLLTKKIQNLNKDKNNFCIFAPLF